MSSIQVAELLQDRVKASNMSITEISNKAKVSRQTLYRLFNADIGEAKLKTIYGVCHALGIDMDIILGIYLKNKRLH